MIETRVPLQDASRTIRRRLRPRFLLILAGATLVVLIVVAVCMDPPRRRHVIPLGPAVGETAPRFTLTSADGQSRIKFGRRRDKPAVLVFGSFT